MHTKEHDYRENEFMKILSNVPDEVFYKWKEIKDELTGNKVCKLFSLILIKIFFIRRSHHYHRL